MILKNIKRFTLFLLVGGLLIGCNDQWDDHVKVNDPDLSGSVLEAIQKNVELSEFNALLQETGYAEVLSGDNNYTVFAPTNEALSAYTDASDEVKKNIVRNHIALLTYKQEDLGVSLMMMSGKNLLLDEIVLNEQEILCANGILRTASNVVLPKDNIYEIISKLRDSYEMASIIYEAGDSVMDPDKSIQLGVDRETGLAYYDTVWMYQNPYLDSIGINNEDSLYAMVLLENSTFNVLKKKYAKYMMQLDDDADSTNTYAFVSRELIYDLICRPTETIAESLISVNDIQVDMKEAVVISEEEASNGKLLVAKDVNIRIKDNKVKELIVQGEDFYTCLEPNYVFTRLRDDAMGGSDVMLTGYWTQSGPGKGNLFDEEGERVDTTLNLTFCYTSATAGTGAIRSSAINSYIKYSPYLYSTSYNIYWVTNDDIENHYKNDRNQFDPDYDAENPNNPCISIYRVIQKMYISEEGKQLTWTSPGIIGNRMQQTGNGKVLVGVDPETAQGMPSSTVKKGVNAGVFGLELPLAWCQASGDYEKITNPLTNLNNRFAVVRKTAGEADIMVTNSHNVDAATSKDNGMIFLDYIRFVPIVDEND